MENVIPKDILDEHKYLETDAILVGYRGSHAHGMYVPNTDPNSFDDIDLMAVVIPDKDHFYGLKEFGSRGTESFFIREWDVVTYEIRKFIRLLAKGNPNVIGLLWLKEDQYLKKTPAGQYLIDYRNLFSSKTVYDSFVGYAHGQLHKMEHNSDLDNILNKINIEMKRRKL